MAAGIVGTATLVAGAVVAWVETRDVVPTVRLHPGLAWVASNEVGQLTLLDGVSAEAVAGVPAGRRGMDLQATQQGATGYALDRDRGSVVRVDGATLTPSRPMVPSEPGGRLAVFPTTDALYTLETSGGLLTAADPTTLARRGRPVPLAVRAGPEEAVTDAEGRLWVLDQRTGDLVWFADGVRRSRADAHAPGESRIALTDGRPVLLHPRSGTMELLDPATGAVEQSAEVGLRRDDTVAVSGSSRERRLLVSVTSRGVFQSCAFGADSCGDPVTVAEGFAELGPAVAVGDRAVVPDYATGGVSIVDLASSRVVAQRRLFDRPVRFDLVTRDGLVFFNDPDSERAGVIDLDGTVRPITKYEPDQRVRELAPEPGDSPGAAEDPRFEDAPVGPPTETSLSIAVTPRDHGVVGDEFELTVTGSARADLAGARWAFGDGTRATGTTVRHRWAAPGTFSVTVRARLPQGQVARAATRVVIAAPDGPHIVRLTVAPEEPRVGERVRFGADLTGAPPQRMAWTVTGSGGTVARSSAPRFGHVFRAPGNYTVALTVTADGVSVRQSRRFTVAPEPVAVSCGDTITADAVLTENLLCTGEVGLRIAASGVDLDLGGYTVATDDPLARRTGIVVAGDDVVENVTVRNGEISGFQTGVELTDVTRVTVEGVTVTGSEFEESDPAMVGTRAGELRFDGLILAGYNPLALDGASSATFVKSTVEGSADFGLALCGSCTFRDSIVEGRWFQCGGAEGTSLVLEQGTQVLAEQLGAGCDSLVVDFSKVQMLGGILADSSVVTNNEVTGNIIMLTVGEVLIANNTFENSLDSTLNVQEGTRGRITENDFVRSDGCGILVQSGGVTPIGDLEISGNTFDANGFGSETDCRDGLRLVDVGPEDRIRVQGNVSSNNAEYGINAEPDSVEDGMVVDGGGNTSSGDPLGCRGIVCG
ncbi:hypothetical protein BU204_31700 [Actinophytocola xanthii]|uniref:PKD domain-containing protein n=1 Tax=Actinophytocola xanthii TaxID=1912961 RepID=A0A1Q8C7P8_9PSEU|nr:hypothetical protein BU204_31700 [Actinophytocola xanthii]